MEHENVSVTKKLSGEGAVAVEGKPGEGGATHHMTFQGQTRQDITVRPVPCLPKVWVIVSQAIGHAQANGVCAPPSPNAQQSHGHQ